MSNHFKKAETDYPSEKGEIIKYTLDGVLTQASFLTQWNHLQLAERKEIAQRFHHEANCDSKTVTDNAITPQY